jgi:hypothetical protein
MHSYRTIAIASPNVLTLAMHSYRTLASPKYDSLDSYNQVAVL